MAQTESRGEVLDNLDLGKHSHVFVNLCCRSSKKLCQASIYTGSEDPIGFCENRLSVIDVYEIYISYRRRKTFSLSSTPTMAECNDLKTGSWHTLEVQLYTNRKYGAVLICPAHVAEACPTTAAFLAGLVAWPELGGSTKMVTGMPGTCQGECLWCPR